jgi:hypothetical protein
LEGSSQPQKQQQQQQEGQLCNASLQRKLRQSELKVRRLRCLCLPCRVQLHNACGSK